MNMQMTVWSLFLYLLEFIKHNLLTILHRTGTRQEFLISLIGLIHSLKRINVLVYSTKSLLQIIKILSSIRLFNWKSNEVFKGNLRH